MGLENDRGIGVLDRAKEQKIQSSICKASDLGRFGTSALDEPVVLLLCLCQWPVTDGPVGG